MSQSEYINNKDFEKLIQALLNSPDDDDIKEEVTICFYVLSENIIRAFNFKLIDKEDALQEGVLACFSKIHRFNPTRGKAFNWFTTIILNHYRQLYRSCKNDINLKKRYLEKQTLGKASSLFEESFSGSSEDVTYRARRNSEQYSKNESYS